jgi:hypothetical protein
LNGILAHEWGIEKRIGERRTAAEGRLGAELRQNQFLDWIIKKTPSRANAGLAIVARTVG